MLRNMKSRNTKEVGANVEQAAAEFLKRKGLKIRELNYHCKAGEIDIIASDRSCLVFVEVRHRKNSRYGTPAETITRIKVGKILNTANHYLQRHRLDQACRFDVIESIEQNGTLQFNWIQNAFESLH